MKNEILSHLPEDLLWQIHWFDTIDSTNTYLKGLDDAPHGTVVIAGHQTGGRGRMGRTFDSPNGGIYLSLLLRPRCKPEKLMHLTCAAGVAMCDAVEKTTGFRPGIKWINDLTAGNRKLGGILTELSTDPATGLVNYAVIGIGINCRQLQEDFPPELQQIATSLHLVTGTVPDTALLAANMIEALYTMAQNLSSPENTMAVYRRDCVTLGKEIQVIRLDTVTPARALDVDAQGALVVEYPDGTKAHLCSGEVSVRGMYGYI